MRCIVKNCISRERNREKMLSFHRFPELRFKKDKWISNLSLKPDDISSRSVVCSLHFRERDFLAETHRLLPSAIPFLAVDPLKFEETSSYEFESVAQNHLEEISYDDQSQHAIEPSFTQELAITVVNYTDKESSSSATFGTENKGRHSNNITSLSDVLQQTNELKAEISVLQRAVVERDRTMKVLNTRIRFKNERIAKLLKTVSKLKKEKKQSAKIRGNLAKILLK